MRYSISALIVTIFNPCALANLANSGTRDMVPSSFIISQITAAGLRARQPRQIYRTFGLPRASEHTALMRFQRKNVAGTRKIGRLTFGIDRHMNRRGPVGGGNAGGDVAPGVDRKR